MPLYAGGAINSRVRESLANSDRARADLENSRRQAALSARQSFLGVTNGMAQVRALEQAVTSSETALASNRLGYEVGVRINIDVLNSQQQLFSTRRDLSRARYDTIVNGLRLKAAAGTLGEVDLETVNTLLAN
jgi:outer membrane protein